MFTSWYCCSLLKNLTLFTPPADQSLHPDATVHNGGAVCLQQSPEGITHLLHIVSEEHVFQIRGDGVLGHVEVYLMNKDSEAIMMMKIT